LFCVMCVCDVWREREKREREERDEALDHITQLFLNTLAPLCGVINR
jgi:hypothetical protein